MSKNTRTQADLKEKAVLFWPREFLEIEASVGVLPLLLYTQEMFISILRLSESEPDSWKSIVDKSDETKSNLFLKHLMVLSGLDVGTLNKLLPLKDYFKGGKMNYVWRKKKYEYQFKVIHEKVSLNETSLRINGKSLLKGYALNDKMEDVIMLLLHGATSFRNTLPNEVKSKCVIGRLICKPFDLEKFIRPIYIRVSPRLVKQISILKNR
jgi:hypothetical protein